jgi:hypothetical protein
MKKPNNNIILYTHTRKDDGKIFYVGIGSVRRSKSKLNRNKYWHNTVNKHDYNINILVDKLTWERACELEILMIGFYGREDKVGGPLVNKTDGGEGRFGSKPSDKQRKVLDKTGDIPSEETKNKISNSLKGRPSPMKGKNPWNKGTKGLLKANKASFKKGSTIGEKTRFKKGQKSPNSKIVLDINNGIFYESITQLSLIYNVKYTTFIKRLENNKYKNLIIV